MNQEEYIELMRVRQEFLSRRASPLPQAWRQQSQSSEAVSTGEQTLVGDHELGDTEEALLGDMVRDWGLYNEVLVEAYVPEAEGRQ